jgi:hypothetical protein
VLEIIGIALLYTKLKSVLARKGRGGGLAFLGPVFWLGGEFAGAFVAAVVLAIWSGEQSPSIAVLYAYAMLGALAGAAAAYGIVRGVPAIVLECPECSEPFGPNLEKLADRQKCPHCKARLRVAGAEVTLVARRKPLARPGRSGEAGGRPADRPADAPGPGDPPV